MSTKAELIEKYVADLKEKCNINADMDLLEKVVTACGPSIYNDDASTVSTSDESEMDTVKNNFLVKKLGLSADDKLDEGIESVTEIYGKSNRNKYRAVFYYLLVKHFKKEAAL